MLRGLVKWRKNRAFRVETHVNFPVLVLEDGKSGVCAWDVREALRFEVQLSARTLRHKGSTISPYATRRLRVASLCDKPGMAKAYTVSVPVKHKKCLSGRKETAMASLRKRDQIDAFCENIFKLPSLNTLPGVFDFELAKIRTKSSIVGPRPFGRFALGRRGSGATDRHVPFAALRNTYE